MGQQGSQTEHPAGLPPPPDAAPVNEAWPAEPVGSRGARGVLERFLGGLLRARFAAQREFNARQVRLDNELLRHLEERLAATHRHYDGLLGALGQRLDEADERHRLLERELVAHVQDLVRRIDVVLVEAGRDRHSLAQALADARQRLSRLEQALQRREG